MKRIHKPSKATLDYLARQSRLQAAEERLIRQAKAGDLKGRRLA